ncbi:MAG: MFS transporter [Candidatus Ruminococcus intestinipullorum]|nr:MFS transporter [Candidatus Ruminococcus intestinipullorum]
MFHLLLAIIYLAFISLGLPDALLGAAWPTMYQEFSVPVSYSGIIFVIIAAGTVVSSLFSDKLTKRFGTGRVTALSVCMTAIALVGFSFSDSFWLLCIWSIPYGFGAGSVDASLNNYVAIHYASRHMSWLHCMWGVGASVGPYIMGYALTNGGNWSSGYRYIGILQIVLTVVLLLSLPLWDKKTSEEQNSQSLILKEVLKIPGAKEIMLTFFCYCAIEQTAGLWASSYLVFYKGVSAETAASFAALFYIGISIGRFLSGFLTLKLNDTKMIYLGQAILFVGVLFMLLPAGEIVTLIGLILVGLGCAPIYPCIIHSTPYQFGSDKSQAMIGVQMAAAYIGICIMPPIFGVLANHVSIALLPVYLLALLILMFVMYKKMLLKSGT